jgi:hypothetical protein
MKLNVKAFALSIGLFTGFGIFFLTWWVILFEGVTYQPTVIGLVYRGFCISPLGSVIGLIWGFFDGLIGGAIFAWFYNLLSSKMGKTAGT